MTKYQKKGQSGGSTPSYPRKRKASGHENCSKKRSLLKNRIRILEARLLAVIGHLTTTELYLGIHDSDAVIDKGQTSLNLFEEE